MLPDLLHSCTPTDRILLQPGASPAVRPAFDELEHTPLDSVPILHDHAPAQSHDQIAAKDEFEIATTILLEVIARMELLSVELDHESVANSRSTRPIP